MVANTTKTTPAAAAATNVPAGLFAACVRSTLVNKSESTTKTAPAAPAAPSEPAGQPNEKDLAAAGQPKEKDKDKKNCLTNQLHKTRFCMYEAKGTCQYGDQCGFAHSNRDLQVAPDLRKTRLCEAFANGSCKDPGCSFAHGDNELRSSDVFFKKTLCIWNAKGKCRNGDNCRFAHGKRQLRPVPPEQKPAAKAEAAPVRNAKLEKPSVAIGKPEPELEPMKIQSSLDITDSKPAPVPAVVAPPPSKPPQSKAEVKAELQRLRAAVSALSTQCTSLKKVLYNPQDGIDLNMLDPNMFAPGLDYTAGMEAYGFNKEMIQPSPPGLTSDWYGQAEMSSW